MSVTPAGKTEPVFGTVWIKSRTLTDRDAREVTLTAVDVPQVRFPDADPEHEKRLAALLEREVPTWDLTMSLDRLLAALELADRERVASEGLNNDPPKIIIVDTPTVLVSIDGEPKLQKIEKTYDVTPEVVYVGYDPGYVNSYVYGGVIVYGTGWHYRPWWGTYYYPRHSTWGFHVRWNPWMGWGFGFSYSTGRFTFSMGFGGWGGWYRGGFWGPRPFPRPYARGYHRGWHHGARAGYRAGARAGYRAGQRQNVYRTANNRARVANQPRATGARPTPTNRPNNVVSDRSGNVHQRTQNGNWQNRAGTASTNTRSLDRTQQSRQRGTTRTQSYNRSTGGGARRGGGGRRR